MEVLDAVRTSAVKNPEEWVFLSSHQNVSTKIPSLMNVFLHEPTDYIVLLFEFMVTEEYNVNFYMQVMAREEYEEASSSSFLGFRPSHDKLIEVHRKSSLVNTFKYIKELSQSVEDIEIYSGLYDYVRERYSDDQRDRTKK